MPILTKVIALLLTFLKHVISCFLKKGEDDVAESSKCKVSHHINYRRKRGNKSE